MATRSPHTQRAFNTLILKRQYRSAVDFWLVDDDREGLYFGAHKQLYPHPLMFASPIDDTFVVGQLEPGKWEVTHLPSGRGCLCFSDSEEETLAQFRLINPDVLARGIAKQSVTNYQQQGFTHYGY